MTRITIRQARPSDRDAMLSITRGIWNGNDYVPYEWDSWLSDSTGRVFVATLDGEVLGLQHTSIHPDNSAWHEGIRVAETARGMGVGSALLQHGNAWVREAGCAAARLSTTDENAASNRIAQSAGMHIIGRFASRTAPPGDDCTTTSIIRPALTTDDENIWHYLTRATDTQEPIFYTEGWTAYALTRERLRLLLATAAVWIAGMDTVEGLTIITATAERPTLRIGLLQGSEEAQRSLCLWARERAFAHGLSAVRATAQVDLAGERVLEAAGYEAMWSTTLLLHELRFGTVLRDSHRSSDTS